MNRELSDLHLLIIIVLTLVLSAAFLTGTLVLIGGDPALQDIYESHF